MKIGLSIVLAFLLVGCGDETSKQEAKSTVVETKQEVVKPVEPISVKATKTVETVVEAVTPTNETVKQVKENVVEVVDKVVPSAQTLEAVKKKVIETSTKTVQTVTTATNKAVESAKTIVADVVAPSSPVSSVNGKVVYKACIGCHGANGEKKALGKSQIIAGWDSAKVSEALNGYIAGTYGGAMKGLMKGQVSKLSTDDIKAVSDYISTLK